MIRLKGTQVIIDKGQCTLTVETQLNSQQEDISFYNLVDPCVVFKENFTKAQLPDSWKAFTVTGEWIGRELVCKRSSEPFATYKGPVSAPRWTWVTPGRICRAIAHKFGEVIRSWDIFTTSGRIYSANELMKCVKAGNSYGICVSQIAEKTPTQTRDPWLLSLLDCLHDRDFRGCLEKARRAGFYLGIEPLLEVKTVFCLSESLNRATELVDAAALERCTQVELSTKEATTILNCLSTGSYSYIDCVINSEEVKARVRTKSTQPAYSDPSLAKLYACFTTLVQASNNLHEDQGNRGQWLALQKVDYSQCLTGFTQVLEGGSLPQLSQVARVIDLGKCFKEAIEFTQEKTQCGATQKLYSLES